MRRTLLVSLLVLAFASDTAAQSVVGDGYSRLDGWLGRQASVVRPYFDYWIEGGTKKCERRELSGQRLDLRGQWAGQSQYIYSTNEGTLATTETKGLHAQTAGVDPALTYRRAISASSPPACPGASPCNTIKDWTNFTTCYYPGSADGVKGLMRGDLFAADVADWNAKAVLYRGAGSRPPIIGMSIRLDLLTVSDMQVAGFLPSFLQEAAVGDKFSDFESWLTADTSYYCAAAPAGCSWNGSDDGYSASYRDRDLGMRFQDQLDYFGGANSWKNYIYYLTRPFAAKPLSPNGVMADMNDDAYVAWRIARIQALLAEINQPNVMVNFGDKLGLHYSGPNGVRNGTWDYSVRGRCPTVTDFVWTGQEGGAIYDATPDHAAVPYQSACADTYVSSSDPLETGGTTSDPYLAGYTYEAYVLGLKNFADALRAAGIPYVRETGGAEFRAGGYYNATATATDEDAVLREIALSANFVSLFTNSAEDRVATVMALRAAGVPYITESTTLACGDGITSPLEGEQCDDGDATSGDGCSSTCVVESCLLDTCQLDSGVLQ